MPSLFWSQGEQQSRVNCNQPTIQSSMDFPLQFHSRGYELSYVLTSQEHNRNHAEIPAQ